MKILSPYNWDLNLPEEVLVRWAIFTKIPVRRLAWFVEVPIHISRKTLCLKNTEDFFLVSVIWSKRMYNWYFSIYCFLSMLAIMKDHSCHDVLLMCLDCHQLSNMRDQLMRTKLANMCNAPILNSEQPKIVEDHDIKYFICKLYAIFWCAKFNNLLILLRKLRSAARALLIASSKHNIPAERKLELERDILKFYPSAEEITKDLLLSACDLQHRYIHGIFFVDIIHI